MADHPAPAGQDPPGPAKKLIVDDDWKAQAQREKDELDQKLRERAEKASAQPLPPAAFLPFVSGIAAQALMQLGVIEHPIYEKKMVDLEAARYSIDIVAILQEKTKGNLTPGEEQYLKSALHDLRMRYVAVASGKDADAETDGETDAETDGGGAGA